MKLNLDSLESKLNNISEELDKSEIHFKQIIKNIYHKSSDFEENKYLNPDYIKINDAYKKMISQYSKEYSEMADWYYGPELPYNIYCKEFKKSNGKNTYLDNPNELQELYFLFIFYAMYNYTLSEVIVE